MKIVFITVTDAHFFPGTVATINSVLHFHPEASVVAVNNHIQKAGLGAAQSALLKNNGVTIVEATELKRSGRKLAAWELKAYASSDLTDGYDLLAGIDSDCVLCGPVNDG